MKTIRNLLILFFVMISLSVFAQNKQGENKILTLKGKLVKKTWTKTAQSYCAQGNEYYVIVTKEQEEVLEFQKGFNIESLKQFENKKVAIKGYFYTRIIKTPQDNYSQHPVGETFTCKVFKVHELN